MIEYIWLGLSVAETVMVATQRCVGLLIVKQGVTVGNGALVQMSTVLLLT
jgi:hypothetical protein